MPKKKEDSSEYLFEKRLAEYHYVKEHRGVVPRKKMVKYLHCSMSKVDKLIKSVKENRPPTKLPPHPSKGKTGHTHADVKEVMVRLNHVAPFTQFQVEVEEFRKKHGESTGTPLSESTLHQHLRDLNYSTHDASQVLKPTDPEVRARREAVAIQAIKKWTLDKVIIAVDEVRVQEGNAKPLTLNAKTGIPVYWEDEHALRTTQATLVVSVDNKGGILHTIVDGDAKLADFKAHVLKIAMDARKKGYKDYLLVLDNASVHSEKTLLEIQKDFTDRQWQFLPPYSPDTNPAESVCVQVESAVLKERTGAGSHAPRAHGRDWKSV